MNKDASLIANQRLREARLQHGWSQQYVADRLGTTVVTVKRWERGFQSPCPHFRLKLCVLFDKSVEELGLCQEKPPLVTPGETQASPCVENPAPLANTPDTQTQFDNDATDALVVPSFLPQVSQDASYPGTQLQRNRLQMLRRLYHSYRTLLTQSLQGSAWITVNFSQRPDAVCNTTTLLFRSTHRAECPLPPGTSIGHIYENAEHELLILGEPGAGKSMLLLHLALQLVEKAMQDAAHPLPILLPLSSWAVKRPTLYNWIKEQLTLLYDISPRMAQQWMQEEQILPLLDGLDEMEEAARPACIKAINAYHREHLIPLVVCSRTNAYMAATRLGRLTLNTAVIVQPLSVELVETHLMTMGQPFIALRTTLQGNPALQAVATTPLMLQMLILTYQTTPIENLSHEEVPLWQQLWTDYVQHMVACKGDAKRYPLAPTNAWLSWLARQMRQQNQTIFFLELMQSDWLEQSHSQCAYQCWAILLPNVFAAGLLGILASTLLFSSYFSLAVIVLLFMFTGILLTTRKNGTTTPVQPRKISSRHIWRLPGLSLIGGLGASVISILTRDGQNIYHIQNGLSYGGAIVLLYILLSMGRQHTEAPRRFLWLWSNAKRRFLTSTYGRDGLSIGLSCAVGFGLHEFFRRGIWYALGEGLRYGLLLGGVGVLLSVLMQVLQVRKAVIEPEETQESVKDPQWSWRNAIFYLFAWKHLKHVLVIVLSVLLIMGVSVLIRGIELQTWFNWQKESQTVLGYGTSISLIILSIYWLQQGYRGGLAPDLLPETRWLKPHRRLWSSAHNAFLIAGISALVSWLIYVLSYKAHIDAGGNGTRFSLVFGLLFGIAGGIVSGLLYGGLMCLRHLVLRILLWRTRVFPWNGAAFLDDAVARALLWRVGNGYSFTHRLLMDYFADLDTSNRWSRK